MTKINFGMPMDFPLPPRPLPPEPQASNFNIEELPPMRFREDAWFLVQDEGYKYVSEPNFRADKSDENIVNKLYSDFHRIPGDIALRIIQRAFGLDLETRDVARALYEASLGVRILS